ncbi:MAG: DUF4230 domain-containing protein [Chloroflexi bacterium]|nr:DUF4230 domain-containing protein [Chloroflexota bacterium]
MQNVSKIIYGVFVGLVVYMWIQGTPAGSNLPKLTVVMPDAAPAITATATATVIEPTATTASTTTRIPTQTALPSATPTVTPTATPAKFTTKVDTMVRKISSARKLTTVETILDIVVTFDEAEKQLGWWDGGELFVQRTTVKASVGIDLQKISIQQINDHWVVSVPESKILSLESTPEKPYYFSKGIRYAFQDGQKDTWRDMMPAEVDKRARERICALGLHDTAAKEARAFIIQMAIAWNPNMTENDITVNVPQSRECSMP